MFVPVSISLLLVHALASRVLCEPPHCYNRGFCRVTASHQAGPGLRASEGAFRTSLGSRSDAATLELVFAGPVPEDLAAAVNGADVSCERARARPESRCFNAAAAPNHFSRF